MGFKIVKTIENGKICITAVPERWESNGTLFWPQGTQIEKLRRNPKSIPSESWIKIKNCVVKRSCENYYEALELEKEYADLTDTDSEERMVYVKSKKKEMRTNMPQYNCYFEQATTSKNTGTAFSSNINSPMNNNNNNTTSYNEDVNKDANENVNENVYANVTEKVIIENLTDNLNGTITENVTANEIGNVTENLTEYIEGFMLDEKIQHLQQQVQDENIKMMTEITKINIKVDKILDLLNKICLTLSSSDAQDITEDIPHFPLKTSEEVNQFEDKLADQNFRIKMINYFKKLTGSTGKGDYKRVCYLLVDKLFTRELLREYTWTGKSLQSNMKKCFQSLKKINNIFFEIVYAADNDFTEDLLAKFFIESALRHSKARSHTKDARTSTPRTRIKVTEQKKVCHESN